MLLQNRIKINPPLKTYILNSINNSIDKKYKLLLEKEKMKNLYNSDNNNIVPNNIVPNTNISGFVFFLSLSIIYFVFSNKK
jgi:hypothetical protein